MDDKQLTRAGYALRKARGNVRVATYEAKTLAIVAANSGYSEVVIARLLGVERNTVRAWLGKPRKR